MAEAAASMLGAHVELDIGQPVHGGACLARHQGRVVFVRHALPGERVRVRITEDRAGSYLRADAVEVLHASDSRVQPPCPHAGPGRCGGCDWQHASAAAQREIKTAVVAEQFRRIASIELDSRFAGVEALPGGLLGWRTRVAYALDGSGRPGLHRARSRTVERVGRCPLGAPGVGDHPALAQAWPGLTGIEAARGVDPDAALIAHSPGSGRQARGRRPPDRVRLLEGPATLRHEVLGHPLRISATGFWQVHPAAADAIAQAVLDMAALQPGERVLDLYAGAGALTVALADAVGADGAAGRADRVAGAVGGAADAVGGAADARITVLGIESSPGAVRDAEGNLAAFGWAKVDRARITAQVIDDLDFDPDVIVLDPPRAGAGPDAMAALLRRRPRCIVYVSCEPATLARDVAAACASGWTLRALRAFDAFPMTQHVECVAALEPVPRSEPLGSRYPDM